MKQIQTFIIYLLITALFTACSVKVNSTIENDTEISTEQEYVPENIIIMIGDGMGLTQITSGMLENGDRLHLEQFKNIGLSKTQSSNELITDSAAGATAISIGEKTYNGAIGVDKNGMAKETILETLGDNGFATGIIATCSVTHATPASFYAHEAKRSMEYEIAADMVNAPLDVFVAGGKQYFVNRNNPDNGAVDDRNILNELENEGFTFVNSLEQLKNTSGKVGYFTAEKHPPSVLDGRGEILSNAIEPVINHLIKESDKGFFLLVEGSQIDWGGHANDSDYIISEMIDFDKAIGEVLEFAKADKNTLVIVTADHETGGYALRSVNDNYEIWEGSFTTHGHTATMVPVFAYGPGADLFKGIYNNNQIYHKIKKAINN